jgi:hypothetical protein
MRKILSMALIIAATMFSQMSANATFDAGSLTGSGYEKSDKMIELAQRGGGRAIGTGGVGRSRGGFSSGGRGFRATGGRFNAGSGGFRGGGGGGLFNGRNGFLGGSESFLSSSGGAVGAGRVGA